MQDRKLILHIVVLALLLYALVSLAAVGRQLQQAREGVEELQNELQLLTQENADLAERLAQSGSPEELGRLARERLGMLMPGEILFYFRDAEA